MDTSWFAVDEDGQVASFETGSGGAMPRVGFPSGELEDFVAAVLRARAGSDARLREMLPETPEELGDALENGASYGVLNQILRSFGVWTYDGPNMQATPYVQEEGGMAEPIHIEAFEEEHRRSLQSARLPLRFRETPILAPGEHVPVAAWDPTWFDLEGRPHPSLGKEQAFAELGDQPHLKEKWQSDGEGRPVLEGEELYTLLEDILTQPDPSY